MEALHGHGHVGDHNAGCASCLRAATPAVSLLVWVLVKVAPLYLWLFRKAYWFYSWAPTNLLQMCFGVGLAFFGGTYVAAIAAVEAFRLMGWQRTWADLKVIYAEMRLVYDRSEEDDLLDDDGNGILDVDELTPQELAERHGHGSVVLGEAGGAGRRTGPEDSEERVHVQLHHTGERARRRHHAHPRARHARLLHALPLGGEGARDRLGARGGRGSGFQPDAARGILVDAQQKHTAEFEEKKERWYETEHRVERLPADLVAMWREAKEAVEATIQSKAGANVKKIRQDSSAFVSILKTEGSASGFGNIDPIPFR